MPISYSILQRLTALFFAIVLVLQYGCANVHKVAKNPQAPNIQTKNTFGKLAIVTTSHTPTLKFQGFARSKNEGSEKGARMQFSSCMNDFHCGGQLCAPVILLWPFICGISGVMGGASGGAQALSTEEVQTAETNASAALEAKISQENLRDQVVTAVQAEGINVVSVSPESSQLAAKLDNYSLLNSKGVDTVLEVVLNDIGIEGTDSIDPPLFIFMTARVRLINTVDNTTIYSTNCVYKGEKYKLKEWSDNQAEKLLHELQIGYVTLGRYIYEGVFLLYQPSKINNNVGSP